MFESSYYSKKFNKYYLFFHDLFLFYCWIYFYNDIFILLFAQKI